MKKTIENSIIFFILAFWRIIVSKFGEVLREYISKNGYSINEFAGKCKIDRAWLSNVLSGRKELSEAKFDNILKSKL